MPTFVRLFAGRDLALGLLSLHFADNVAVTRVLARVGASVDAADASAALLNIVGRRHVSRASLGVLILGSAAAVAGLQIAREQDELALREVIDRDRH